MPDKHVVALALHVAISSNTTMQRLDEIRKEIESQYPEILSTGFHGMKDYNSEYPTQF